MVPVSWKPVDAMLKAAKRDLVNSVDWKPVGAMLGAAKSDSVHEERRLLRVLAKSRRLLRPLDDPLDANFGLHRWLSHVREEAYSDWLAWLLLQLDAERVLRLLRACDHPSLTAKYREVPVQVDREVEIRGGRLDIKISARDRLLLIVEVKKVAAEDADTDKQRGYTEHAHVEKAEFASVLLVTDAVEQDYEGFRPLKWSELCIALRQLLPELSSQLRLVRTAMFSAFIGAIERNLLSMIGPGEGHHGKALLYARTADHIERSLRPKRRW